MRRNFAPHLNDVGTGESATAIGGEVEMKAKVGWTESSANEPSMRFLSKPTPSMTSVAEQVRGNTSVYGNVLIALNMDSIVAACCWYYYYYEVSISIRVRRT